MAQDYLTHIIHLWPATRVIILSGEILEYLEYLGLAACYTVYFEPSLLLPRSQYEVEWKVLFALILSASMVWTHWRPTVDYKHSISAGPSNYTLH